MPDANEIKAKISLSVGQPERADNAPPTIPDHEMLRRIGSGSYGEVWLARNAIGTWRAVKVVYRNHFKDERPYEREFSGIQKYEPISRSNEGLVDVLQIGRNDADGYFYYVMELADNAQASGASAEVQRLTSSSAQPASNQSLPALADTYVPKTLASEIRARSCLPVDECITLGITLNLALGHLHRSGLIHRDVKPSNIIFVNGVAKLADIGLVTELAEAQSFVGTEGFIPPEGPNSPQADIFALGKVLYEASMGKDRQEFPEPRSGLGVDAESKVLMELNAVLLRACAPDPKQRYQTAEEMNADLALLHSGKSVQDKHALERRLKLTRRVAVATVVVLVLGVIPYYVAIKEARRATTAADKARSEASKSKQVAQFLKEMLEGVGPSVALGRDTTILREVLDATAGRIGRELTNQAEVEAELCATIGEVYDAIGEHEQAVAMFSNAVAIRRRLSGGKDDFDVAGNLAWLATALRNLSKLEDAERIADEALAMTKRLRGDEDKETLAARNNLALILLYRGNYSGAEHHFQEILEIMRKQPAGQRDKLGNALNNLASALEAQGKAAAAEPLLYEALEEYRRDHGEESPEVASMLDNLGKSLQAQQKLEEAKARQEEALAMRKKLLGNDHPDVVKSLSNLADVLWDLNDLVRTENLLREGTTIARSLGTNGLATLHTTVNNLGVLLANQGRFEDAEPFQREALTVRRAVLPKGHPLVSESYFSLTVTLSKQGKGDEAEQSARECLTYSEENLPGDWRTFSASLLLGRVLVGQQKFEEAESRLISGYEGLKTREAEIPAPNKVRIKQSVEWLVKLYEAWGKPEMVGQWKQTLEKFEAATPRK